MTVKKEQQPWIDLAVPPAELRLDPTLTCGQAFRWKLTGASEYTCAIFGHVIDLKQTPTTVLYRSLGAQGPDTSDIETSLRDYFQLGIRLEDLCNQWIQVDPTFAQLKKTQTGVRMLRQPVTENLLTFIASSNNNIKRITMLVDRLCQKFGHPIDTAKGTFHAFPTISDLAQCKDLEATFKDLGFGYRAKYYATTVRSLADTHECPESYLLSLRRKTLAEARIELLKLSGVGPKVADCVCLMSLDKHDAVPVDTHIWQIAQRRYVARLRGGSGTTSEGDGIVVPQDKQELVQELVRQLSAGAKAPSTKSYEAAQQLIIALFGPYAGWAQGMLFSGDLDNAEPSTPKNEKKASLKRKPLAKPHPEEAKVEPTASNTTTRLRPRKPRLDSI
ncbi:8-oxoguanine glycosylase ogg1 [Coemansia interrupta]|uniref:DNA-(apurinic or apyrimidinic site) lyase n=1 Tax=Coemansia interrupta TaxID=1126814 RepID=A0A9W8LNL0_9FUNG|nr:8-oxoguanine glycosylase ogg1 [Coemansia interrupta]